MDNRGVGIYKIDQLWTDDALTFFEKSVGQGGAGNILRMDTKQVTIGDASQDIDLKVWLGATQYALFDAGDHTVTLAGLDVTITGDLTIDTEDIALGDNDSLEFGDAADVAITWDTDSLNILPATDNTGTIEIGNGTKDIDVKIFMNTTSEFVLFDVNVPTVDFGASDKGVDLRLYGETAANYLHWDQSEDDLLLVGTSTQLAVAGTATSSDTTTGSLRTAGGLGVVGTAFIGGLVTLTGATGLSLTGTLTKGINFAGATPAHADADDAFIAIGTWNDTLNITTQAYHFVPIQVNLTSGTSIAADIAAARFRVNTHASTANTLTAVNVLEMRSKLQVAIGSHANLQVSTEVSENIACTGDLLVGYFSLQGDGVITCSNHVNVLEATCVMSSGASGIDNVGHFTMNSAGVTATNALKAEAIAGTVTSLINVTNTGGTVTNGILLSGQVTTGISMPGALAYIPVQIGTKASSAGSGFKIVGSGDNSGGIQIYADDGGEAAAGEVITPMRSRYLLTIDQSGGITQTALFAQLVSGGTGTRTYTTGGFRAAYVFNQQGTTTLVTSAECVGINQATTLAGTMTVGAGCSFSGIDINIAGAGAITNNGTCAALLIRSSGTPVWTNGIQITSALTGITMTTTSKGIDCTVSTLNSTTGRIAKFDGTVLTPNFGDGYGAVEINLNIGTGATAGRVAAASAWVNFAAGTTFVTSNIAPLDVGIWGPTGMTMANSKLIMGMNMSCVIDDGANPGSLYLFSTNISDNALTAMFDINTIVDITATSGAAATGAYKFPILKERSTGTTWYVNMYTS